MLLLEESRLKQKSTRQSARDSTPSSPHVLLAAASNNRNNSAGVPLCCNFQRCSCNFGERCKYVHTNVSGSVTRNGNGNTNNRGSSPQWNNTTGQIVHGPAPGQAYVTQPTIPLSLTGPAGVSPSGPPAYTTGPLHGTWGPQVVYDPYVDQATTLPQAFNAMTVQNYGDSGWYMDIGATSHLASDTDGSLSRYKARLVANGRSQQQGIDCDETFSPVVKPATIRTVLSLAVSRQWPIHQLDVKNAFLHGHLSETVYMHQPPGFVNPAHLHHHNRTDSSLFIFQQGNNIAYLLIYVDDIILTASSGELLKQIISSLHAEFSMADLGPLNYFLGISAQRISSSLFLSQTKYAREVIERPGMMNCNPYKTPVDTDSKIRPDGDLVSDPALYRSLASLLQYLTFTRPDLSYTVQQAGCPTTWRFALGYCVFLGDNLITWSSKHQHVTSRSSAEAEYHRVANVVAETAWVKNLLHELLVPLRTTTFVYYDNFADIFTKGLPSTLFAEFRSSLSIRYPLASTAGAY
ncbi:ribonuclease H-like domain-containing protein [Tanacetum coccineum]